VWGIEGWDMGAGGDGDMAGEGWWVTSRMVCSRYVCI
jgi:hypothetical protein